MSKRSRRKYTAQEKVAILRKHFLEGRTISDVCDAYDLNPTQFYRWQKEYIENGAKAFERTNKRTAQAAQRRQVELEGKLSGVWVQPDLRGRVVSRYPAARGTGRGGTIVSVFRLALMAGGEGRR